MIPVVLTIAGSDSGGGAGIQADLKTFAAFGVYGTTVITALTAQNTLGVSAVQEIAVHFVLRQLDALTADLPPAAAKTGMLASARTVAAVAERIADRRLPNLVVDPVLKASSGEALLEPGAVRILREKLLPLARVVTPNLDEAEALTGLQVRNVGQMRAAALALCDLGAQAALVKGGHLSGGPAVDVLAQGGSTEELVGERLATAATHGLGCTLSAALAAGLARGLSVSAAAAQAKRYVERAMAAAPGLGKGRGPLNHQVPAFEAG